MTRRLGPKASCHLSVTSLSLLLYQQPWPSAHCDLTQPPHHNDEAGYVHASLKSSATAHHCKWRSTGSQMPNPSSTLTLLNTALHLHVLGMIKRNTMYDNDY